MRRRLLFITLATLAIIVAVVATLPLWLGRALAAAGRSRGLTFASYERIGYGRFLLRDVEYRRLGVRVTLSRAEADTPALWVWRHWRKNAAVMVGGDWRVEVEPRSPTPTPNPTTERGWIPLRGQLQRIAFHLDRWLPRATIGAGIVRWPGDEISLASATWGGRELSMRGLAFHALRTDATAAFAVDGDVRVTMQTTDGAMRAKLENSGARVQGDIVVWDQTIALDAAFDPRGWLPASTSLQAKEWTLSGERLKVGALYSTVRGSGQVEWQAGRFVVDIKARSEPLPGKAAPPLDLALRGTGDLQTFTMESLNAVLPGLTANLSDPVTIERTGRIRTSTARFVVQADLAKMPWFAAAGSVTGEGRVVAGAEAGGAPTVEFSLDAHDVRANEVVLSSVSARGRLNWPRVEVVDGTIAGGDGERLTWRGGWDFQTREMLNAVVEGRIRRASVARWLPRQPEFDEVTVTAEATGPIAEIKYSGRVRAENVRVTGVAPLGVSVEWNGRGAKVESFRAEAAAGGSRLRVVGAAGATSLTLSTLELVQEDVMRLRLSTPATLHWRPQLQLEPLRLNGPEGSLELAATAGESGKLELSAAHFPSRWLGDFVSISGPAWTINRLALSGAWERGPMTFALTGDAGLELGADRAAAIAVTARGDKAGVRIEALRASTGTATVIDATGRLPITFTPGTGSLMHIDAAGPLVIDAQVAPNTEFWRNIATASGVELADPQARAKLTGTWQRPEGRVTLQATRIVIDPKRFARALPGIEAVDVEITGDRAGVTLSKFSLNVEGQAVRAQGRLPMADGQWTALFKEPLALARRGADLRLEVPDAEVAVFTRFLPAVLAPKGRLQADVRYTNGGVEGFVRLREAASRPLGPLGVLQEITADTALSGRTLTLRSVTAKSGGQPITLSGTVEWPETGAPKFGLALRGENLPFVRQTGLLLRGDVDLKLETPSGGPPRLSGNVRLRDSLFLSDVRSFLPKGGTGPRRRPPYFAIETAPLNAWLLGIEVTGEKFLRLRTPVFSGLASARFRLSGTLGEPRAIGEFVVDEGSIRMPFASFAVTQGAVRLTEADPFDPVVYLRGTGRRYGYDLTMEIDGSTAKPDIVFTSSPALDSEQVLLMVMTGTAPSNELARSATQRVANVGLFLGQSLLTRLGADASEADRLSFSSGEKISRQGRETYEFEYKLSDRWMLTGEKNEFDEYNVGVKWRVFRGKRAGEDDDHAKK